jgi:hypothetical protein
LEAPLDDREVEGAEQLPGLPASFFSATAMPRRCT